MLKYIYSLIEVVAQAPAYASETRTLEGPAWQLIALGADDRVIYQPDVAVLTATVTEGRLSGNAQLQ